MGGTSGDEISSLSLYLYRSTSAHTHCVKKGKMVVKLVHKNLYAVKFGIPCIAVNAEYSN